MVKMILFLSLGAITKDISHLFPQDGKSLIVQGETETLPEDVILDGEPWQKRIRFGRDQRGRHRFSQGLTIQNGSNHGIAIEFANGKLHLILSKFIIQNNSTDYMGGGLHVRPQGNTQIQIEIRDSIIRNNEAPGNSEGMYGRGGGIHINTDFGDSTTDLLIINSLIYKNRARATGGGLQLSASENDNNNVTRALVINSTITSNVSHKDNTPGWEGEGGGIAVHGYNGNGTIVSLDLYNTILYGNVALGATSGADLYFQQDSPGTARVNASNCNINGIGGDLSLYHATDVINSDPLFVDPDNDNYRLMEESPCVDTGTAVVPSPPGLPGTDFDGNPRIVGRSPDIGAYEFVGLNIKPKEGTIGTIVDIIGSEFGSKKGKVWIGQTALKVMKWTTGWIQGALTKAVLPGVYDVTIEPKGAEPVVLEDAFTAMAPVIDSVDPASGSTNDEISVRGQFFGTKKGKITLGGRNCRILKWTMNSTTGGSEVRFAVPKDMSPGDYELKITNGTGSDAVKFIVD